MNWVFSSGSSTPLPIVKDESFHMVEAPTLSLYEELARTHAPRVTAKRRLVINANIMGHACKDDSRRTPFEVHRDTILRYLDNKGPRNQSLIARDCNIGYRRMNEILNRMKALGLITRTSSARTAPWTTIA